MTDVLIKRELLELSLNGDEQQQAKARNKLREQLAAPRQPEGEGLEVVANQFPEINFSNYGQDEVEALQAWGFTALDAMADAQRAIAELRDRLDVMTQCADNYSRMFEESEEECERLRVKLMTIASAEPGRHNIEWAKAMAATGNNEAYAKWREAFDQRDKLAITRRVIDRIGQLCTTPHESKERFIRRVQSVIEWERAAQQDQPQ